MTRIAVDPGRELGRVDRKVFGGFIEHLGRCVYGGIYDEGSPLADGRGFRRDVLELLRGLRVPVLRWPGGNFASNYHWADGIGPAIARPRRADLAWGAEESNRFGTGEFLAYCAELGAEPYICLNMGTGTLAEALAWVEYCNGSGGTAWADRRRRDGHPQPYRVRYWALGNEMYGDWQVGAMSAREYTAEAVRWARAIKRADPGAILVSCGKDGWSEWDRIVIDGLAPLIGYHSVHIYTGSDDYWANVLQPHQAERAIRSASALIERAAYRQRIADPPRIACDEWNVWYRTDDGMLAERYTFPDALAVATYLNIFLRNCRWVGMANLAQLVNAIAPVVTTATAAATQPIYYPVLLHAQAALEAAADVHVEGPLISHHDDPGRSRWPHRVADLGPFSLVDAAATVSSDRRRLALTLVNRGPDEPETAEIVLRGQAFGGQAQIQVLTAGQGQQGGVPGVAGVTLTEGPQTFSGDRARLTLPAQSFTVVTAALASGRGQSRSLRPSKMPSSSR